MKKLLLTLILATAGTLHLSSQTSAFNGFCESGGRSAVIQGLSSTNKLNGVIPSCTVSVYMTGTTTLATIYKDNINTPLANPFTANNLVAAGPGQWLFYALTGPGYDVVMSGGIPPNVYLQPVTLTDLQAGGGGGGGGPSILTNNVPNTSQSILNFINPAAFNGLSFAFSNPSGGIETFGVTGTLNNAGITNPQTTVNGQVCVLGSTCTITTTGTIVQVNGVNITTQSPVNFQNSASVAFTNPSAGIIQASVDVTQGIGQFIQPPIAGQFVILTPTGFSKTDAPAVTVSGDLTSADMASGEYCSFPSSGTATWTFTGALEAQFPTLNPANVTAVYAAAVASNHGLLPVPTGCLTPRTYNVAAFSMTATATGATGGDVFPLTSAEFESVPATAQLVSLTGANIDTTQIGAGINMSGDFRGASDTTVTGVRLFVYYTGSPVSSPGFIPVNVPLLYSFTNGLSIDPNAAFWGTGLQAREIRELPPAASWPNAIIAVTDGVSNADCTTGFGSTPLQCRSTGSIWTAYGGGGGGGSVGTAGQMQMAGATSGSFAPSACTDDGSTITCTEPIQTVGPPFGIAIDAGTAVAGASGTVVYASDATSGFAEVNENNTGLSRVCTAANGICAAGGGTGIISRVSCVTYGCVADGNLGANTGTDNTSFFSACLTAAIAANGVCYVPAGTYRIATSLPSITVSGTGFVGDVQGFTATSEWVQPSTTIFSSSASATILTISSGSYIFGDVLQNIALQRAVTPNTGSIALLMNKANTATITGNVFADSSIGADITDSPSTAAPSAGIKNNGALWCYSGVSAGAGPNIGFNLHGSGAGFISLIVNGNVVGNSCGASPTSYGYKLDGNITDLNMSGNQTAGGVSYALYMSGTGGQDVQILESTFDRCLIDCVYDAVNAGNSIEIRGGWMTGADSGQTAVVELNGAAGTSIKDITFFVNQAVPVIYNHGLQDGTNAILNNRFYLNNTGAIAISANNGTALNIVGNSIVGAGLTFTNPVIKFVNQSFGNITSNWLGNGAGTGISFDASSNSNCCSNLNTLITYTVSDAGTGNSFASGGSGLSGMTTGQVPIAASASTVTSSKALAGSGTGITTGPTSSTVTGHITTFTGTGGQVQDSGILISAIPLANLAVQAADSVVMNATGSSAVPTAVSMPACTTGADLYNTSTHAWSCVSTGGTSTAFPYAILQTNLDTIASGTSHTTTFSKAAAGSGATLLLIIGADGTGAFTGPSGWTCSINATNGSNFPRIVACIVASSGQTSATWSDTNATTPGLRLYELSGTRTFDITSGTAATTGSPTLLLPPAITPTAGSAVFSFCTAVNPNNGNTLVSTAQGRMGSPLWTQADVWGIGTANIRDLMGGVYNLASDGTLLQPPQIPLAFTPLSASGAVCATFSIK